MSILSKLFPSRKRRDVDTLPVREKMAAIRDAKFVEGWAEAKLQKTIRAQGNALEMEQLIRDTLFHARRTLVSVGPEWLALEKRMEELLARIEGK